VRKNCDKKKWKEFWSWGYYIEVLHAKYQKKLEKILYKLKLTLTLLFPREKCITPLN
jgi:hypothetical protein